MVISGLVCALISEKPNFCYRNGSVKAHTHTTIITQSEKITISKTECSCNIIGTFCLHRICSRNKFPRTALESQHDDRDLGVAGMIFRFKGIEHQELELGVHYAGIKFPVRLLNVVSPWHGAADAKTPEAYLTRPTIPPSSIIKCDIGSDL